MENQNIQNNIDKVLYDKVTAYIEFAKQKGLEAEVITTALTYIKDDPQRYAMDVAMALKDALTDWDCY